MLGELQGGGGSAWLKVSQRGVREKPESLAPACFRVRSTKSLKSGRMGRAKGHKYRGGIALTPLRGSQSPAHPHK